MKLHIVALFLSILAVHAQDVSNNITSSSLGFDDTSKAVNDLEQAISESKTCALDFNGNGEVSVAQEDYYDNYYRFCRVFCGDCDIRRRKRGLNAALKTLKVSGECDDVTSALEKAANAVMAEAKSNGSQVVSTDAPYYPSIADFFCDEDEGFCAGYYNYAWCANVYQNDEHERHLEKIENLSMEEIMTEIDFHNSNPNGLFNKKESIISEEACEKAVNYLDLDKHDADESAREPKDRSLGDKRNLLVTGEELVEILGKEDTKSLLNFFHDSLGRKAPVTKITLQRTAHLNEGVYRFGSHVDGVETMIVYLSENGNKKKMNGGGIFHYSGRGLLKTEMVKPGLTIVHGKDVLHETYPWNGVRDIIDIQSNPGKANEPCMLWDLVN